MPKIFLSYNQQIEKLEKNNQIQKTIKYKMTGIKPPSPKRVGGFLLTIFRGK